jgi:hypothetical protein
MVINVFNFTSFCNQSHLLSFDWLLKVQWTVYRVYSGREQALQYIRKYSEMRENWTDEAKTFDCHGKSMDIFEGRDYLALRKQLQCGYSFSKST